MTLLARANIALETIAEGRRMVDAGNAALQRALSAASPNERDIIEEWLERMDRDRVD